jgi:RNA polymerase sigma-70 factor (ECF subfamily)
VLVRRLLTEVIDVPAPYSRTNLGRKIMTITQTYPTTRTTTVATLRVSPKTRPVRKSVAEMTVAQLVTLAQSDDREAMGELFKRYQPAIEALAMRRVRNAHEAEELAQDVFIQAMQKVSQLRVPEAFGGWLRQIVHRMAINRVTRGRLSVACDPETLEATCIADASPETVAEDREQADAVRMGLTRLGDMDQQTLRAFYLQGQTLIEMSDRFDAPVGTIKRRLHTARKRLAETMRNDFPATVPMNQNDSGLTVSQAV